MEKTIKKNLVFNGRIINVYNDDVLCSNGNQTKRELVSHHGGAGILIVNDKKEILLIEQFRYAYQKDLYEIPAGKLEKGEDPYTAALREMEEETGYKASKLESLGSIYPTCGYSNEIIYLYYADSFIKTSTHFDPDEDITYKWYKLEDVLKMIEDNIILDAKTIVAVYKYYLRMLNNEKKK